MRNYIVNLKGKRYCFYYEKGNGILYRTYEHGKWSGARTVYVNARGLFSVNISFDGKIYIFCQDTWGNAVLCGLTEDGFNAETILKAAEQSGVYDIFLNALIMEKGMMILYNMPLAEEKTFYIMSQRLDDGGNWLPAEKVDRYVPGSALIYQLQYVTENHLLAFYQTKTADYSYCIGYREITPDRRGGFNAFYTGTVPVFDYTVLTTNSTIHAAYVLKGVFSSQLIYRKRDGAAFTRAAVIWESQRISSVWLYIVKNKLYLGFYSGDIYYTCVSDDNGESFGRAFKYQGKLCQSPQKAFYLQSQVQSEDEIFLRDIYTDTHIPWDVQIIPDLHDGFYLADNLNGQPYFS